MHITAFVATHHLPEESMLWIREARDVFGSLVIFLDENRLTPGTLERAERAASRVYRRRARTWYELDFGSMARACNTEWVFILDYDEQLSPEWQQAQWRHLIETREFTHFFFPRRQLVPNGRYISSSPWWPDFQLRLLRNQLEGTTFPRKLHDTIHVPGRGGYCRNLAIHHHVFRLFSREARAEKVRLYEQLRPGGSLGHQYLYEDLAPPTRPLPATVMIDLATELGVMNRLPRDMISQVSLRIGSMPPPLRASGWYWFNATVTNNSDAPLSSFPPFPVRLAYHWLDQSTRRTVVFDGVRTDLLAPVEPNATSVYEVRVVAPDAPGDYILQMTLVQENVCWFEDVQPQIVQEFSVRVS